jgi:hypothetical protein
LTLVKEVVDPGGGTAVPSDWLLSATGPATIQGRDGQAAVTAAVVPVGDYVLAESDGPPGYEASDWECAGAAGFDAATATVTIGLDSLAVCTIVNTTAPGVWDLTKLSDPSSGTTVAAGTTITYTLLAEHESGGPVTGAIANDDLSAVLTHATLVTPLAAGLTQSGSTLTWAVPTIPVGGAVQVSYQVRIDDDAQNVTIDNVATPGSPGGHCSPCATDHAVVLSASQLPSTGSDIARILRSAATAIAVGVVLVVSAMWGRRRLRSA